MGRLMFGILRFRTSRIWVQTLRASVLGPASQPWIILGNRDGMASAHDKPWRLQLVSFDVQDENGDEIFEPGGHVVVRRICISSIGEHVGVVECDQRRTRSRQVGCLRLNNQSDCT